MPILQASEHVAAAATSQHGDLMAILSKGRLRIVRVCDQDEIRVVPTKIDRGVLKWSHSSPSNGGDKLLLYTGDDLYIWDLNDVAWSAHISNATRDIGRIVRADFGGNLDEVVTIGDFAARLTLWSLKSSRNIEIRDPKSIQEPYAFHPSNGTLAVLSRPAAQDLLMLFQADSREVVRTVELHTVDAKGLKWSPDGQWLAIWDSASHGAFVELLTADATPFRLLDIDNERQPTGKSVASMLGVTSIVWSSRSDALAVAGFQADVRIYSARTFGRFATLHHPSRIEDRGYADRIWQQMFLAESKSCVYQQAHAPIEMSTSSSLHHEIDKAGSSILRFNEDGSLLASYMASTPGTVWVWDIEAKCCSAVLINLKPARQISWHPTRADVLLILLGDARETSVCLWQRGVREPVALESHIPNCQLGKTDVRWVGRSSPDLVSILDGDSTLSLVSIEEWISQ